jgi:hypothetical protein
VLLLDLYEVVGLCGVSIVLLAYLLLNLDRINQKDISFSLLNCMGSMLILVSFIRYWNVASFVIEISWLTISLYGVLRCTTRRRAST